MSARRNSRNSSHRVLARQRRERRSGQRAEDNSALVGSSDAKEVQTAKPAGNAQRAAALLAAFEWIARRSPERWIPPPIQKIISQYDAMSRMCSRSEAQRIADEKRQLTGGLARPLCCCHCRAVLSCDVLCCASMW
jgi:hypothetical protein